MLFFEELKKGNFKAELGFEQLQNPSSKSRAENLENKNMIVAPSVTAAFFEKGQNR